MMDLIQKGTWPKGEKLPGEIELAASFGVSRNIMREALKILENFGVLDAKNGVGTFVSQRAPEAIESMHFFFSLKDNRSVEQILELRLMVEPDAAYLAALRIREEDLAALKEMSEHISCKFAQSPDYQDDFDFHIMIAHYSGNILCENLIRSLLNQLRNSLYAEFNQYASPDRRKPASSCRHSGRHRPALSGGGQVSDGSPPEQADRPHSPGILPDVMLLFPTAAYGEYVNV